MIVANDEPRCSRCGGIGYNACGHCVGIVTMITINGERQYLKPGESVQCKIGDDLKIEAFGPAGGGGFIAPDTH